MGLVEKIGEVRPGVDRRVGRRAVEICRRVRRAASLCLQPCDRVDATRRVVVLRACRRPLRHQEEMRRETPRRDRFEHVVLEHEVARVLPVVRDVPLRVVAHHVGIGGVRARGIRRIQTAFPSGTSLSDESVHLPAVDVGHRVLRVVGAATIDVRVVDVRPHTVARRRIRHARSRLPGLSSVSHRRRGTSRSTSRTNGSPAGSRRRAGSGESRSASSAFPTPAARLHAADGGSDTERRADRDGHGHDGPESGIGATSHRRSGSGDPWPDDRAQQVISFAAACERNINFGSGAKNLRSEPTAALRHTSRTGTRAGVLR